MIGELGQASQYYSKAPHTLILKLPACSQGRSQIDELYAKEHEFKEEVAKEQVLSKFDEIENLCSDREIVGIEGYCYLISSYKTLSSDYLSNKDIINGVNFIKKAIEKGILDEKVYGWWLFDDLRLYGNEFSPSGIPLSADLIYYISTNEALKLLEIVNKFE